MLLRQTDKKVVVVESAKVCEAIRIISSNKNISRRALYTHTYGNINLVRQERVQAFKTAVRQLVPTNEPNQNGYRRDANKKIKHEPQSLLSNHPHIAS